MFIVQVHKHMYLLKIIAVSEDNFHDDGHFICLVTHIEAQALSNLHFGWMYDN